MAKKKKIRVDLRKNRAKPPRKHDWTSGFHQHGFEEEATAPGERVRARGDLSRRRTIVQEEGSGQSQAGTSPAAMPAVDVSSCVQGRVLRVHRQIAVVATPDHKEHRCTVRQVLKSLTTEERNIVTTGDRVWFLPTAADEGVIERVEPRHGILTRASRGREHVLVSNVDQVLIVVSLAEPDLKPHLIDRYLASATQGKIAPLICLNKADLVDPVECQPLVGFYSQLDIPTLLTSASTGMGLDLLSEHLKDRETVLSGQSGVGKSSLLNALQPGLHLAVRGVSEATQKGRHTTTTAELHPLDFGGWVVDTPGIRQFELWDVIPEEVEGFFPEFHPFVPLCAYPDCTHTHEDRCAVKRAVGRRQLSERRYLSYLGMFHGEGAD
jgi:ribosome biogenesis GTPase